MPGLNIFRKYGYGFQKSPKIAVGYFAHYIISLRIISLRIISLRIISLRIIISLRHDYFFYYSRYVERLALSYFEQEDELLWCRNVSTSTAKRPPPPSPPPCIRPWSNILVQKIFLSPSVFVDIHQNWTHFYYVYKKSFGIKIYRPVLIFELFREEKENITMKIHPEIYTL